MLNNVFIIGMPGCGNLGDDIISQLLVKNISEVYLPKNIYVLSGNSIIKYPFVNSNIHIIQNNSNKNILNFILSSNKIKTIVNNSDLIVIGGGGLFQDQHYFFTIYNYLKYLAFSKNAKAIVFGVGIGPLKKRFNKKLLKMFLETTKNLFVQLRDPQSEQLLLKIGIKINSKIGADIIEGSSIEELYTLLKIDSLKKENCLGCNIRPWSNIEINGLADFIEEKQKLLFLDSIKLFVFENLNNNNSEKIFLYKLKQKLEEKKLLCSIFIYNETENSVFFNNFFSVKYAIASRLHANILWQKFSIPTLPIPYSDKIMQFYIKNKIFISKNYDINKFVSIPNIENIKIKLPPFKSLHPIKISLKLKIILNTLIIIEYFYRIFNSVKNRLT